MKGHFKNKGLKFTIMRNYNYKLVNFAILLGSHVRPARIYERELDAGHV